MADLREELQASLGDEYILEQEIRGGGMSRVFLAQESSLKRPVVLKVLPPEMAAEVSADRFRREVHLAAQLQHPHIVPLLTASETDQLLYFTMPYVKGDTLREHLRKEGELPVAETVRIMREIALALAYAHDKGVVHRDIKPENILISGGCTVVTDFGIAKAVAASGGFGGPLTSHGIALGTPAYMAPEQIAADIDIDYRADIYSLGVVAYEMLAGATPFAGRSAHALAAAQVTERPEDISRRRSSVPPALAALVMSCLEKRPADRPQSVHEILRQLDALTTPNDGMQPMTARAAMITVRDLIGAIVIAVAVGGAIDAAGRSMMIVARSVATVVALSIMFFGIRQWGSDIARLAAAPNPGKIGQSTALVLAPSIVLVAFVLSLSEPKAVEIGARIGAGIHVVYSILFVPATFLITATGAFALGRALDGSALGAKLAANAGLTAAVAFLAVDLIMDTLGWRVGAPGAAQRATMVVVTTLGLLAASVSAGAVIGKQLRSWRGA